MPANGSDTVMVGGLATGVGTVSWPGGMKERRKQGRETAGGARACRDLCLCLSVPVPGMAMAIAGTFLSSLHASRGDETSAFWGAWILEWASFQTKFKRVARRTMMKMIVQ